MSTLRWLFISSFTETQRLCAAISASTKLLSAIEYSAILMVLGKSAGFVGQATRLPVAGSMPAGSR